MVRRIVCLLSLCLLAQAPPLCAETLRIPAVADVWLSHATEREEDTGAGGSVVFKLKSVQELAAIRFRLAAARGRRIEGARLHLRSRSATAPHWLRVSTVTSRWTEGKATRAYSGHDGATWRHADAAQRKAWAWPGSEFSDVCMGAGGSLVETVALSAEDGDWFAAEIPPELVVAMVCGASDGLALMEGGSPHDRNHYFHSAQSWESAPWLELELGETLGHHPPEPVFRVRPAPELSRLESSTVWVELNAEPGDYAWRGWLNGEPLDPWRLPPPGVQGAQRFALTDLAPNGQHELELCVVGMGGELSPRARVEFISPDALPPALPLGTPESAEPVLRRRKPPTVWALPALSRADLSNGRLLVADPGCREEPWNQNPVWDAHRASLVGAAGETVSFQVLARARPCAERTAIRLRVGALRSAGRAPIPGKRWRLRESDEVSRDGVPLGAYLRPLRAGQWTTPDSATESNWRSFLAELPIPPDARAGVYRGEILIEYDCGIARLLPVELDLRSFRMPAAGSFRVELNAYRFPDDAVEYFRLARRHRAVFTPWVLAPGLEGDPPRLGIDWEEYDARLGPLLDGSAFADEDGRPLELLYLPFWESWPLELDPENYDWPRPWPRRGDPFESLWDHHELAPPIEQALSPLYLETLQLTQRSFVDHFEERGWNRTEMHCFYGSKMQHFTRYGRRSFWNTDEPLYLADWQALRFFASRFESVLEDDEPQRWLPRADVSRPEWLEGALGDAARIVYTGPPAGEPQARRLRSLRDRLGIRWMVYGRASLEGEPPVSTGVWALEAYLDGAEGALIWLSLGDDESWREMDPDAFPGTALMARIPEAPLPRGDLRLLALREAQQLSEWLRALAESEGLNREQVDGLLRPCFHSGSHGWWQGLESDPGWLRRGWIHAHDWERIRRLIADRVERARDLK